MLLKFSLTRKDNLQKVLEEKTDILQCILNLGDRSAFEINLILDEICTNIFEHNADSNLQADLEMTYTDNSLEILIADNGVAFDPTSATTPDTRLPLEERKPGGLGLVLLKSYATFLHYQRLDGVNWTTIKKSLKKGTVKMPPKNNL